MGIIQFDKTWEINTKEDYDKAMEILEDNRLCAEMCDDFSYWKREITEYNRQKANVIAQATAKGII